MNSRQSTKSAEDYLKYSKALQTPHGLMLLEKLNPKEGDQILDLGCGSGNLSVAIAEKTGSKGKVVAVDPDKNRIAVAKSKFGHIKIIEFKEGSAEFLPCEKSYFDGVFMNYVLHWIEDKKNALENIYEVLKSGGQVAMLFNLCMPSIFEKVFRGLNLEERFAKKKQTIFYEDIRNVENYCKEIGFVITEGTKLCITVKHPDLLSFLKLLSTTYYDVFDLDQIKEEKIIELKMKLDSCYKDEEGRVVEEFPVGVIIASKP